MEKKIIEALAGAMVMAQVDVCGLGMFRAPDFAKEVLETLQACGYEIRLTLVAPDATPAASESDKS